MNRNNKRLGDEDDGGLPAMRLRGRAKEGLSLMPVATGVVVALGTLLLLSGLIGAILVGVDALPLEGDEPAAIGFLGSLGLLFVLFVAYLWGGYTAGRMARTSGLRIGLLVALAALGISAVAAAAADSVDLEANLTVPFTTDRLPIEAEVTIDWDSGLGLLSLAAMLLGGAVGGRRGADWHTKVTEAGAEQTEAQSRQSHPSWHGSVADERVSGGLGLGGEGPPKAGAQEADEGSTSEQERDRDLPRYR